MAIFEEKDFALSRKILLSFSPNRSFSRFIRSTLETSYFGTVSRHTTITAWLRASCW